MSQSKVLGSIVGSIVTLLGLIFYPEQIWKMWSVAWASQALWHGLGVAFIVLVIGAVVCRDWIRRLILQPQIREHDLDLFLATSKIIAEHQLLEFLDWLGGYQRGDYKTWRRICRYMDFHRRPSNEYRNRSLQRRWRTLIVKLDDVGRCIRQYTTPAQYDREELLLTRNDGLGHEEADRVFEAEMTDLSDCTTAAVKAYHAYIAMVNKLLPEARKLAHDIAEAESAA